MVKKSKWMNAIIKLQEGPRVVSSIGLGFQLNCFYVLCAYLATREQEKECRLTQLKFDLTWVDGNTIKKHNFASCDRYFRLDPDITRHFAFPSAAVYFPSAACNPESCQFRLVVTSVRWQQAGGLSVL